MYVVQTQFLAPHRKYYVHIPEMVDLYSFTVPFGIKGVRAPLLGNEKKCTKIFDSKRNYLKFEA